MPTKCEQGEPGMSQRQQKIWLNLASRQTMLFFPAISLLSCVDMEDRLPCSRLDLLFRRLGIGSFAFDCITPAQQAAGGSPWTCQRRRLLQHPSSGRRYPPVFGRLGLLKLIASSTNQPPPIPWTYRVFPGKGVDPTDQPAHLRGATNASTAGQGGRYLIMGLGQVFTTTVAL
ncbi:hypothetical protein HPP92_015262 [Vanilla planifolia]|uniref:Uncharacterized protein n=1 Tax=Vanilla planifolia TaxID=51239 RepID=A0A835QR33_VANPL|nr:hypothetical protein HPP92_015262 [Vanilla planifolia]